METNQVCSVLPLSRRTISQLSMAAVQICVRFAKTWLTWAFLVPALITGEVLDSTPYARPPLKLSPYLNNLQVERGPWAAQRANGPAVFISQLEDVLEAANFFQSYLQQQGRADVSLLYGGPQRGAHTCLLS